MYVKSDILEELRRRRNDDLHLPERNSNGSTRKEQSARFNHTCSYKRVRKLKIFFFRQRDQMNFGPTLQKTRHFYQAMKIVNRKGQLIALKKLLNVNKHRT